MSTDGMSTDGMSTDGMSTDEMSTTGMGAARVSTTPAGTGRPFERKVPPVTGLGMAALTAAITGGVLMVSQIGEEPALVVPGVLTGAAIILEIVAAGLLVTIGPFAWSRFAQVFGWALLAYLFQSGIIEWSFIKNDVPGGPLVVLTVGLVVFATVVPLMVAFTVARYERVEQDRVPTQSGDGASVDA